MEKRPKDGIDLLLILIAGLVVMALAMSAVGCGTVDGVGKLAQGMGQDLSNASRGYQAYAYEHKDDD